MKASALITMLQAMGSLNGDFDISTPGGNSSEDISTFERGHLDGTYIRLELGLLPIKFEHVLPQNILRELAVISGKSLTD